MTPVDQEFIHAPEQGLIGDCQRAVIASLLDLPIADVPHFMKEANGDTATYWERIQSFVRSHGFAWLVVPARSGGGFFGDDGDVFHEISGPSPRGNGITHAVVGCNGKIVFDPHPSRAGLAGDSSKWEYAYLVRVGERANVSEQLRVVTAERDRLLALINTPELVDFPKAVQLEAAHQVERWGAEQDDGKEPADWYWLVGYLSGKALHHFAEAQRLQEAGMETEFIEFHEKKAAHHCITAAAALSHWHAAVIGKPTAMRPGIDNESKGVIHGEH